MLLNKDTAGGQQRNDEDYNVPTGLYLCQFREAEEIPPKADDETKTPRLIFQFDIADGPYKGKKLCSFVRKNLFAGGGAKNAKPSQLYKMARSLGAPDPMNFDTEQFVGRYFQITAENLDGKRGWPVSIIPAQQPAGAPSAPPPPGIYPPPPSSAPADDSRWQVYDAQNKSWMVATGREVRHYLTLPGYSAGSLMVTPAGQQNVLTAAAHGFLAPTAPPAAPDLPPPPTGDDEDPSKIPF